jgi:hypothetical protein
MAARSDADRHPTVAQKPSAELDRQGGLYHEMQQVAREFTRSRHGVLRSCAK